MLKRLRHLAAAMPSAPALAADTLPIAGPYGDVEAKGCDYQGETEGGSYSTKRGAGGECGCRVKSVKKSDGDREYAIVASCQCIERSQRDLAPEADRAERQRNRAE